MGDDGTTTLNILNPDNDGVINEKERVITLGQKIGKLKRGLFIDSCECVPLASILIMLKDAKGSIASTFQKYSFIYNTFLAWVTSHS